MPASCSATTAKPSSPTPLPTASPDRVEWCQTPFHAWSAAEVTALAFDVGAEDVLGSESLVDLVGPVGAPPRAGAKVHGRQRQVVADAGPPPPRDGPVPEPDAGHPRPRP